MMSLSDRTTFRSLFRQAVLLACRRNHRKRQSPACTDSRYIETLELRTLLSAVAFSTSESQFDVGVDNQGWWASQTTNADSNDNYLVGRIGTSVYRQFFSFDLSSLDLDGQVVTSATLEVRRYEADSPDATETLRLFDVSTNAATLNNNSGINSSIFTDLGTGTVYGSFAVSTTGNSSDILSFSLNEAALADITGAAGGFFSIGGSLVSLSSDARYEFLEGYSSSEGVQRLVITTGIPNVAPVAVDDAYQLSEDGSISGNVLTNDSDANGDPLTATIIRRASHGNIAFSPDGSFTYTPHADFNGTDEFTYRVHDGSLSSNTATVTFTVEGVNDAPVAVIGGPYSINEGESLTLDASASFDVDGDLLSYFWDLDNDGQFDDLAGATPTLNWSQLNELGIADDGQFAIRVRVDDGSPAEKTDASSQTAETTLTVHNVAPTLSDVFLTPVVDENGIATLTGTVSDPGTNDTLTLVVDWGDPYSPAGPETVTFSASATGTWNFTLMHRYLDDGSSGNGSSTSTVRLTLSDDDGDGMISDTTVTVNNVAPVITEFSSDTSSSLALAEGDAVTVSASFTDVGTLDTHTAMIDWGDGTTSFAPVTEFNGNGSVSDSHVYEFGGIYTVTITLMDDDGGADRAEQTVSIAGMGIHEVNGQLVLQIVGTDQDDRVIVHRLGKDRIAVHADFLEEGGGFRTFQTAEIDRIELFLGGGDQVTIAKNLDTPVLVNDSTTTSLSTDVMATSSAANSDQTSPEITPSAKTDANQNGQSKGLGSPSGGKSHPVDEVFEEISRPPAPSNASPASTNGSADTWHLLFTER